MKEAHGCIYLITNFTNGKRYVGQYKNALTVIRRWKRHVGVALNTDDTRPLYRALRKAWRRDRNLDSFEFKVIWRGPIDKLHEKEIYYIAKLHAFNGDPLGDRSYNLTKGGDGVRGLLWSKAARKRLVAARTLQFQRPEVHERMSAAQIRRYEDDPTERTKQGEATRRARKNPVVRKRLSASQFKRYEDPAEHEKTGAAVRHAHEFDPGLGMRMSAAQLRRYENPAEHEKQSAGLKRRYEDPVEREKQRVIQLRRFENPAERKKTGRATKRAWAKRTPEERSAIGLKARDTRRKNKRKVK